MEEEKKGGSNKEYRVMYWPKSQAAGHLIVGVYDPLIPAGYFLAGMTREETMAMRRSVLQMAVERYGLRQSMVDRQEGLPRYTEERECHVFRFSRLIFLDWLTHLDDWLHVCYPVRDVRHIETGDGQFIDIAWIFREKVALPYTYMYLLCEGVAEEMAIGPRTVLDVFIEGQIGYAVSIEFGLEVTEEYTERELKWASAYCMYFVCRVV